MLGAEWKDFDIDKVKQRVKAMIEGLKFESFYNLQVHRTQHQK